MILKASKRSGGRQLGAHLLKTEENEHVEIHEVSGFISDTVMGAMIRANSNPLCKNAGSNRTARLHLHPRSKSAVCFSRAVIVVASSPSPSTAMCSRSRA